MTDTRTPDDLAVVDGIFLGIEDHGILTIKLDLMGVESSWVQSYGDYSYGTAAMDGEHSKWSKEDKSMAGLALSRTIVGLCNAFGVYDWNNIKGKQVWVKRESSYGPIVAIKPVGKEKEWLSFRDFFPPL